MFKKISTTINIFAYALSHFRRCSLVVVATELLINCFEAEVAYKVTIIWMTNNIDDKCKFTFRGKTG